MKGILYRIEQGLSEISTTGKKVGIYILNNPAKVIWLSSQELAGESGVSKSAISRFCKHFGLSGYNDLKILISQELSANTDDITKTFGSEDFKKDIPINLFNQVQRSLYDTAHLISKSDVMQAAQMLHNAENIMCIGIGASYLIAEDLIQKLLRLQKRVFSHYDPDLKKVAITNFTPKDLLIAVSYSGKKEAVVELAQIAKKRGVPIIAISRYGDTPLSDLADITLNVASFEHEFRISALSSRISQLYLVDVLFYTYGLFFEQETTQSLRKTYDIINK